MPTTSREAYQNAIDAEPHYIITDVSNWRSEKYSTRAAAQAWLDGYLVAQQYKDAHYRIVNAREYERKHLR